MVRQKVSRHFLVYPSHQLNSKAMGLREVFETEVTDGSSSDGTSNEEGDAAMPRFDADVAKDLVTY